MPVCLVDRVSARGEDVANRGRQESLEGVKHRPQRGSVRAGRRREIEVRQTVTARETSTTDTYTVNAHELTLWLSPAGGSSGTVCHWRVRRTLEGIRFAHAHHSPGAAPHPAADLFTKSATRRERGDVRRVALECGWVSCEGKPAGAGAPRAEICGLPPVPRARACRPSSEAERGSYDTSIDQES